MRRVYAVPDANGVITISCGNDQIEIVVGSAAQPPSPAVVPPRAGGGFGFDIPPWKRTHAMIVEDDLSADGVDDILDKVRRQLEDRSRPDPEAVVLSGQSRLNIHDYARLAKGLGKLSGGVSLAAGFGTSRLGD